MDKLVTNSKFQSSVRQNWQVLRQNVSRWEKWCTIIIGPLFILELGGFSGGESGPMIIVHCFQVASRATSTSTSTSTSS
jgi:hypothetical protein